MGIKLHFKTFEACRAYSSITNNTQKSSSFIVDDVEWVLKARVINARVVNKVINAGVTSAIVYDPAFVCKTKAYY
jgi:hypothetical protein